MKIPKNASNFLHASPTFFLLPPFPYETTPRLLASGVALFSAALSSALSGLRVPSGEATKGLSLAAFPFADDRGLTSSGQPPSGLRGATAALETERRAATTIGGGAEELKLSSSLLLTPRTALAAEVEPELKASRA